jgi:hypothetical protein
VHPTKCHNGRRAHTVIGLSFEHLPIDGRSQQESENGNCAVGPDPNSPGRWL